LHDGLEAKEPLLGVIKTTEFLLIRFDMLVTTVFHYLARNQHLQSSNAEIADEHQPY
jgi:hypothetical protein